MAFVLPPLPFEKTALDPIMSAETFDYHHGKHHNAYVQKVNGWEEEKGLKGKSLVEVIHLSKDKGDKGLFNNAAQIWNHTFFWNCLAPAGSTKPSEKLAKLIDDFGGQDALIAKLKEEAVGRAIHQRSGKTQFGYAAFQFGCSRFCILQSNHGEARKPPRIFPCSLGQLIVDVMRQRSRRRSIERVEAGRGQRKNLKIDASLIHVCDAPCTKVEEFGL